VTLAAPSQTPYNFVVTVTESDAEISGLPPGATVRVRVSAANDAGESAPSAAAEIVMPT